MIAGMDPALTTRQLDEPGPWHERLPHFRHGFLPSSGDELQSEYFVPREAAREALAALRELANEIEPLLHVTELRAIAGDDLWLSGAYGGTVLGVHFTWLRRPSEVARLLPKIEERLLSLGARPHWGKLFAAGATQLASLFPRWNEFTSLRTRFDPDGRLANPWTARVLGR